MIQDIFPNEIKIEYSENLPSEDSVILCFDKQNVLIKNCNGSFSFPVYKDFAGVKAKYTYLFKIDNKDFFLINTEDEISIEEFRFENVLIFRTALPRPNDFAGFTAYHLYCWYNDNKFCGQCGSVLKHSHNERMLLCEKCGNNIYPKISPVVIVGITDGDKLLMTKYAGRAYKKYSLVAGFIEIGETIEDAARREVMEEVGLRIKNITYYKNQPWGFSGGLLIGFFAELDGDSKITLDTNELSEGIWMNRDEIDIEKDSISLTNEMIYKFKHNL